MTALAEDQIDQFWADGFLTVPNAVSPGLLERLQHEFNGWVEQSRSHRAPYGQIIDGRPRFDVEEGHRATKPALRRVAAPTEVSDAYFEAMANSAMTEMVADLIGPNVKLHHTKVNSKLPLTSTAVKWHQDFAFTPHSNDSVVTALLMVDEVTSENGPLEVMPGSHRGPIFSLWHNQVFTGAMSDAEAAPMQREAVTCTGPAGSVCLMHTRLAHGSAPNRSSAPRTLFICVYSEGDSVPLSPNPVPCTHSGILVSGKSTGRIRSQEFEVELPEYPTGASFHVQQEHPGER